MSAPSNGHAGNGVHPGDRLARLRRLAGLTQEQVAERSGISVDVIRRLEQHRKHSARLPTLHALAKGLGVELTSLLGDPPGVASNGAPEPPALVELRRAIMPSLVPRNPDLSGHKSLSIQALRESIADGWSLYHGGDFDKLITVIPGVVAHARLLTAIGTADQKAAGAAADAAGDSSDPLLAPMIHGSVAWAYQRQNRLGDAQELAITSADSVERGNLDTAARVRVWGGLMLSAATSSARMGNYDEARDVMIAAEEGADQLIRLPPLEDDGRMLSVLSRSSVRIERVRLAVQHARPDEALQLAKGFRLSADTPPSWRSWLVLDVARAYTDLGDAENAVRT